tara:strand:- start:1010 stop:1270 length:261 start_codon:yes stop_codon:yes gene_type:complete
MYYVIAKTYEEKKDVILYYENIRKQMEQMREKFEEIEENKYNNKIIKRVKIYNAKILLKDIYNRPEFIEPLNKNYGNKKINMNIIK